MLALLGLTAGTLAGSIFAQDRRQHLVPRNVDWDKVNKLIAVELALYLFSFIVAGRPLSALWKLSGSTVYYTQTDTSTAIALLDNMTLIASGTLLATAAARRRIYARPGSFELAWLLILCLQTLGTGGRARFYLVSIGWLIVQFGPALARPRPIARRATVLLASLGVLVLAVAFAEQLAVVRSRGIAQGSIATRAVRDIDGLGTAEILFERGATPGVLGGRSYLELPALLLPRRFIGSGKPTPAADNLVRERVDATSGLAAPLWIEPALNFGRAGVVVFCFLLTCAGGRLLTAARTASTRGMAAVGLLGPAWVLISFLVLSRLTILQCLSVVGAVSLGAVVAGRCLTWRPAPGAPGGHHAPTLVAASPGATS